MKRRSLPFGLNPDWFKYWFVKVGVVLFIIAFCILSLVYLYYSIQVKKLEEENAKLENDLRTEYNNTIENMYAHLGGRDYVENLRNIEELKKEEKERRERVEYVQTHYKIGDRIKFFNMEKVVPVGESYRLSITGIGTVNKIIGEKLYGDWGDYSLTPDGTWAKVESNREWRDLVDLQLKGKLNDM